MTSLVWEGLTLPDIVAHTGTPALLASERRLRENIRDLQRGLESSWPSVLLRYCAKTNPELAVLRIAREEGMHVLASHAAEVELALAAGFAPEQIAYQRPVCEERELDAVMAAGVRRVHAFRVEDLDHFARIAVRRGISLRVSLRIALGRSGMLALSSASRRLGMDRADAERVRPREGLVIDALNTYIGTQQEHAASYRPAVRELARLAVALRAQDHPIEELNLGGGIPSASIRRVTLGRLVSRGGGERESGSPAAYAKAVGAIAAEEIRAADPAFQPRLVFEPGRAVVGNAAILLTRVVARNGRWRFIDCGRNVLVESPLAFTRWMASIDGGRGDIERVHLSGPTLNTLDVVDVHRRLPRLQNGDVLALGDAGAYTIARATRYAGLSPAFWLAGPDGELSCIRREETYADLVAPMLGAAR